MKYYFAPIEGLTGYIYRNAHKKFFNSIDKYFSPFISPNKNASLKKRELDDLLPENNKDLFLVPQILTNNECDFIITSNLLEKMGYDEVNLNLGCPYGTVVSKYKGAGFLSKLELLDLFFDKIFSVSSVKISVKTRLGINDPEEFFDIIEIFNKYPIHELIIHPRIQKDFYKNKTNLKIFREVLNISKNPVCYNGDIFNPSDYKEFKNNFPNVESIMIGRGLIANPNFIKMIKEKCDISKDTIKDFHDMIYKGYKAILFETDPILYKMKFIWPYLIKLFDNNRKYEKKIKKSSSLTEYEKVVIGLFSDLQLIEDFDNM